MSKSKGQVITCFPCSRPGRRQRDNDRNAIWQRSTIVGAKLTQPVQVWKGFAADHVNAVIGEDLGIMLWSKSKSYRCPVRIILPKKLQKHVRISRDSDAGAGFLAIPNKLGALPTLDQ